MLTTSAKGTLLAAGIVLLLTFPACGKKAPLRLSEDRAAERAPSLRARVREGRVTLDFRVPAHRFFPEREEPWVLARILRQPAPSSSSVEVGAILKAGGFAFDSTVTWSDQALPPKSSFLYRVEFRDAVRRRRALSDPLAVSWGEVPDAPESLTAAGHLRSIILSWTQPRGSGGGITYRVYRRQQAEAQSEPVSPEPVGGETYVDSRVEAGSDYCYVVRAVLNDKAIEVEGPASPESCSRPDAEEAERAQPPGSPPR